MTMDAGSISPPPLKPAHILISALNDRSTHTEPNKPREFPSSAKSAFLVTPYLVDDDVSIGQNKGINRSRGIDTRHALRARTIQNKLASYQTEQPVVLTEKCYSIVHRI